MDVSVIIVNYNALRLTSECLDTLFAQTKGVDFEVIVVDNGSQDGSSEHLRRDERITFVSSPENIGFGRANNLGLSHARGKYVFFLNNDTLVLNDAVSLFHEYMEGAPPHVACAGCLLCDTQGHRVHSFGALPTMRACLVRETAVGAVLRRLGWRDRHLDNPPRVVEGEPFPVGYVTGAALFVRRSVIEALGAFDPDFFMYYEDAEMQKRYAEQGYVSHVLATPHICHLHGASSKGHKPLRKYAMCHVSCLIYHRKHSSPARFALFRVAFLALCLLVVLYPNDSWAGKRAYFRKIFSA